MRWIRSNCSRIVWLAFFALACQFALTFGHVHSGGVSAAFPAFANSVNANDDRGAAPLPPSQKSPCRLSQDFCAVCNQINLGNALVFSASPSTALPSSFAQPLQWALSAIGVATRKHAYFDARGPPKA
jgi:hypothetical protein